MQPQGQRQVGSGPGTGERQALLPGRYWRASIAPSAKGNASPGSQSQRECRHFMPILLFKKEEQRLFVSEFLKCSPRRPREPPNTKRPEAGGEPLPPLQGCAGCTLPPLVPASRLTSLPEERLPQSGDSDKLCSEFPSKLGSNVLSAPTVAPRRDTHRLVGSTQPGSRGQQGQSHSAVSSSALGRSSRPLQGRSHSQRASE